MKNIKTALICMFSSILLLSSCQDAYEIEPIGLLDDAATFQSVEDAEKFLNGVYGTMGNLNEIYFTSVFTDEVAPSPSYNGQDKDLHRFVLNSATSDASAIWLSNYRTINRVNRLLKGAQLITLKEGEEAQMNDILAQARTMRAMAYLTLLSYFSTDMSDDNALGVMLYTEVPSVTDLYPRSKNADVFALIEDDLNYAAANISTGNAFIFPNRALVDAVKARMYAYRKDYPNAKIFANNVVNNYGLTLTQSTPFDLNTLYTPNNQNPYRNIWADYPAGNIPAERFENIFSLQSMANRNDAGFEPASLFYFNTTSITGSPIWGMGINLYESYTNMPDDVRQYAYVDKSSKIAEHAIMIDKYPGIPGGPLRNNLKLYRLSEMYFILAEAAVQEGQLGEAANYLNAVRDARSTVGAAPALSFSSATEAWGAILDERRKELSFEGHRYVDIKRLGTLGNRTIDRSIYDDEVSGVPLSIENTDYRFTLPIPLSEISGNPQLANQQNPGY